MKKGLKFYLGVSLVAVSANAFAGAGWRGESKIVEISINYHNQGVALRLETSVPLNACGSETEVIVNRTIAGYSEIYSAILTAYAAKKTINVWVSGACENYRNIVTAISVKD